MKKWVTFAVLLTLVAFAQSAAVSAVDFPKRNITIIVAGSPGDGLVIGTVAMYRAKADGYTLGHLFTDGMLGKQLISGVAKTGYDVTKFNYIARVGAEPYSLIVGKNSRFHTLDDLRKAKRVKWGRGRYRRVALDPDLRHGQGAGHPHGRGVGLQRHQRGNPGHDPE